MITRPPKDQKNFFYFVPEIRNVLWTHEIGTIARFFVDSGYRVFLITSHIPESLAPHWYKQFSLITFPAFHFGAQRIYWPFFWLLRRRQARQVFCAYAGSFGALAAACGKIMCGGTLCIKTDAFYFWLQPTKNPLRKLMRFIIYEFPFRCADAILVETDDGKERIAAHFPAVKSKKFIFMPNGISPELEQFRKEKTALLRKEPIVLFVGKIIHRKGLHVLIEAFASVASHFQEWKLMLCGPEDDPQYSGTLKSVIERRGLSTRVKFLGPRYGDDLLEVLAGASVFCLPSLSFPYAEGFPNALPQAMFFENACIASNIAAIPFILQYGKNGILLEPGDKRGLQDALLTLMQNQELRERYVHESYRFIESRLLWRKNLLALKKLLAQKNGGSVYGC